MVSDDREPKGMSRSRDRAILTRRRVFEFHGPKYLVGAEVWTGTGQRLKKGVVILEESRIAQVGRISPFRRGPMSLGGVSSRG